MKNNKLQIRNSTADFLLFTKQSNKNVIESDFDRMIQQLEHPDA